MTKKLIFLATEDWFVRSHFLPLVRRAREEGCEVAVAARDSGALASEGVRVIAMPFARRSFGLLAMWREARAVRAMLASEAPALVHVIALKPILLALLAGRGRARRALAVTGRGYIGVSRAPHLRILGALLARWIRAAVRGGDALLVENEADRAWVEAGAKLPDTHVTLMPGAGIDFARFAAPPEPDGPFVVGAVSRLIWSKGLDLLVEAVRQLNARGRAIRLRIAGGADAENPEAVPEATLARWRATPGVELVGAITDVAGFWAETHAACFPTRGGEGLPRSLLEAAACGRALLVTDTPGCADFVRAADAGVVVPPESAALLSLALESLMDSADARQRFGAAARRHVLLNHTEQHAADAAAAAWARLA